MELAQALAAIKQLIGQGQLEEAYDLLVRQLDGNEAYSDLAEIARLNQADLYQLKSQTLKGTIAGDEARIVTNKITDNALKIIAQIETGKPRFEEDIKPTSSKALRYYIIGGVAALMVAAILLKVFQRGRIARSATDGTEKCPAFSQTAEMKVMILPFKQTGAEKALHPEFDLQDGLNDLVDETPGLTVKAIADVYDDYDINKDYPTSARAIEIAQHCDARMIVWGKVNQTSGTDYTIDVRYRLLDAGGVQYAGDTTISRLLDVTKEGNWNQDVKSATRLLYLVLANQMRVPIAANKLKEFSTPPATTSINSGVPVDTSTSLVLADQYILKNEPEKAIAEYDKVLNADPANEEALKKRGALLLDKKDYEAAARDLGAVSLKDKESAPAIRVARTKAYLKSSQPDKALHEVESAKKEGSNDGAFWQRKMLEVQDSVIALQERRDIMEQLAAKKPRDADAHVDLAKANLGLGDTRKAISLSSEVLKRDPKNLDAVQVSAEAHLQQGDTAGAIRTLESAQRAGVDVKSIRFAPVQKLRLLEKKQ